MLSRILAPHPGILNNRFDTLPIRPALPIFGTNCKKQRKLFLVRPGSKGHLRGSVAIKARLYRKTVQVWHMSLTLWPTYMYLIITACPAPFSDIKVIARLADFKFCTISQFWFWKSKFRKSKNVVERYLLIISFKVKSSIQCLSCKVQNHGQL